MEDKLDARGHPFYTAVECGDTSMAGKCLGGLVGRLGLLNSSGGLCRPLFGDAPPPSATAWQRCWLWNLGDTHDGRFLWRLALGRFAGVSVLGGGVWVARKLQLHEMMCPPLLRSIVVAVKHDEGWRLS
jgi:hypothetical protein